MNKIISALLIIQLTLPTFSLAGDPTNSTSNVRAINDCEVSLDQAEKKHVSVFDLLDTYLNISASEDTQSHSIKLILSSYSQTISNCLLLKAQSPSTIDVYLAALTLINQKFSESKDNSETQKYLYLLANELQLKWNQKYASHLSAANKRNVENGLFSGAKMVTILFVVGSAIASMKNIKNVSFFQRASRTLYHQEHALSLLQRGKLLLASGIQELGKRPILSLALGSTIAATYAYGHMPFFPSNDAKDIPIAPAHFLGLDLDIAKENYDHISLSQKISGYQLLAELTTSIASFGPIYNTVKNSIITYHRAQKIRRTAQGLTLLKSVSRGAVVASIGIGTSILISELASRGTEAIVLEIEERELKKDLMNHLDSLQSHQPSISALASVAFTQSALNLSHFFKRDLFQSEMKLNAVISELYEYCENESGEHSKKLKQLKDKFKHIPEDQRSSHSDYTSEEYKIYEDCFHQNPDLRKKIDKALKEREEQVREYLNQLPFQYHSDYEEFLVRKYLASNDQSSIELLTDKGKELSRQYLRTYSEVIQPFSKVSFIDYLHSIEEERIHDIATSLIQGEISTHPNHLLLQAKTAILEYAPAYQRYLADYMDVHMINNNLLMQDMTGLYNFTDSGEIK